MKTIRSTFLAVLSVAMMTAVTSCHKGLSVDNGDINEPNAILFSARDAAFDAPATKATSGISEVSSLTEFWVGCETGTTVGSETQRWTNVRFTGPTNGLYVGHKYWPHTDEQYNFCAANNAVYWNADRHTHLTSVVCTPGASGIKDYICAYLPYTNGSASGTSKYRVQNELVFEHVLGRIRNVSITAMPEFNLKDVTVVITPKTTGVYSIRDGYGHTDRTGWVSTTDGSQVTIFSESNVNSITNAAATAHTNATVTDNNDVWLIPGEYIVYATWTACRDYNTDRSPAAYDYVRTYTSVPATINVVAGKRNDITAILGGDAVEIEFTTHIAPWGNDAYMADFSSAEGGGHYLTFSSSSSNTVALQKNGTSNPTLEYSYNLHDWFSWNGSAMAATSIKPLYVRGTNASGISTSTANYSKFVLGGSGSVKVTGNVMSLINYTTPPTTIPGTSYCFYKLFDGCTLMTKAPNLPATTLKPNCYQSMFSSCSGITEAPQLPANTLQSSCYQGMFSGCTGLTTAPDLLAVTLVSGCYSQMFSGCSNLNKVRALFTTDITSTDAYTSDWLKNVKASGTFAKNNLAAWSKAGDSGVPSGWTIVLYGHE